MKIFIIGQCTLHWGRMEFGNIGNYYILEVFVRELHRVFPRAELVTTFQLSDAFCQNENISCVDMGMYYGWKQDDLQRSYEEFAIASLYQETGEVLNKTPFISEVLSSDLVIDFSGDIWGANADFLGKDRFLVGLLKDRVVQLLNKPIAMIAGSPGPFNVDSTFPLAKKVFENFDLVTNRESVSRGLLEAAGFDTSNVEDLTCPAFLFQSQTDEDAGNLLDFFKKIKSKRPLVGFILCGWNFIEGPFDKWPREDYEYEQYIKTVEFMINEFGVDVCFLSHSNGFELPPKFKPIHGRDFPVAKQLKKIMDRSSVSEHVHLFDQLCTPSETKAVLRQFDMLVSGRVHAAVGALSQFVPTVIVDYGHEPKAHKLKGFAQVAGVENLIADPSSFESIKEKVQKCWIEREELRKHLLVLIPRVQEKARLNFDYLKRIVPSVLSQKEEESMAGV